MNYIYIILIVIIIILGLIIFKVSEPFTNASDVEFNFPQTKIINHSAYGYIKCFDNNDLVCNIILNNNIWEEELFNDHIKPHIKENTTIFDCGSFVGSHTILINKLNRNNDIIAFEMMPEHYKLLVDNIKMNNYENILPFNTALSDKFGWTTLPNIMYNKSDTNFGATTLGSSETKSNIPMITLDHIENYLRKPLSFIKMDVEGYELFALKGGLNIITKYKPIILIEIWKHLYENFINSEVYKYLQTIGYNLININADDYLLKID